MLNKKEMTLDKSLSWKLLILNTEFTSLSSLKPLSDTTPRFVAVGFLWVLSQEPQSKQESSQGANIRTSRFRFIEA